MWEEVRSLTAWTWWTPPHSPRPRWCRTGAAHPSWTGRDAAERPTLGGEEWREEERNVRDWLMLERTHVFLKMYGIIKNGLQTSIFERSRTSSRMCSTCSSNRPFRSLRVLFFFSSDWPMRAASSRSRSFCTRRGKHAPESIRKTPDGVRGKKRITSMENEKCAIGTEFVNCNAAIYSNLVYN